MEFQLGMTVDVVCMAYLPMLEIDDVDLNLNARSQWVATGKKSVLNDLNNSGRPGYVFFFTLP